ncbi:putative reverse transcriptase domain-containing protein [Tanacetum coccineum]
MPPKSALLTQAAIRRMIKESVDAAIADELARQVNVRNNVGAVELRRWFEKTEMTFGISECAEDKKVKFVAATLKLMTAEFCPAKELQRMENELWNLKVKEYNMVAYTQKFNELALMCSRMVKPESVKVDAYIRGLTDNIKGKATSSKPTNLNEAVRMAHNSGKSNHKDNSRQSSQKNQKQGNARAMTTAPNEGKVSSGSLPVCECFFTRHVGQCTLKCHKCGKIGYKIRYCKQKNVATGANAQPIWTCYDCDEQGHTRNRCPKKVKQEEVREVCGKAYAIKDVEPQGPNVLTGTFLLNNRYASVLFNSGSDRSFVDTRFSSMLDIDLVKIETMNHLFEIDLMLVELGTFDVIIGMDWLVKHDAVIICGEKVIRIPYRNKTLTVDS